ncbi:SusE domain-containing protein [Cesiribacter andamanensis]|uniref:SusE outer membrane protein domain-containing protein n=1 Tax=Cesiribacter andamanensis AMV16 TaxID=1279009 RepID=M7NXP2_9BACT|nr:SusE domain-containing protein [Cesiribacter andamanensis]EMR03164.1 hypothetical protein ADICEAN_01710 [Cesiribacter andamanensis AMV16]
MKKIHLFTCLLIMLSVVWSCEEKDNLDPIGNWDLSMAQPTSPAANAVLVLDEDNPTAPLRFEWGPATSSKNYGIRYSLVLVEAGSADLSAPIYRVSSGTNGRDLFATPTARQIDQALSIAGYEAGSTVDLQWGVVARSLDKETVSFQPISITRFLTESAPLDLYLSGPATEQGSTLANAIPMKAFTDPDGNPTSVFEVYTSLKAGETFHFYSQPSEQSLQYGGTNGQLQKDGAGITAPAAGTYRITVDFNTNTYNLLKIDKWSVVGGNIQGGWGGDAPLQYQGNGVWKGTVDLTEPSGFVFRANGDWAYLLKRIKGTTNQLVMESQAGTQGIQFEDIPSTGVGPHVFTLTLSGDEYTYSIEEYTGGGGPAETPEQLFLLAGGEVVAELTKNGDRFTSGRHLALQAGQSYSLNSASDGSGTSYALEGSLGQTDTPNADKVEGSLPFGTGSGAMAVARDQAYRLTVDFASESVSWMYYNIKLFHWDEVGGGWDGRSELLMTYEHPYTFRLSGAQLTAGYHSKFFSPWDVQFGADSPTALSGTMTNGGDNITNITESGLYDVTIEVANDYSIGTYEFVKQ